MQPLFTTQSVYTYEEYKRFIFKIMNIKLVIILCAAETILIAITVFSLSLLRAMFGYRYSSIISGILFSLIIFAVFMYFYTFVLFINIRITYESNKAMKRNPVSTVCFYLSLIHI